jgi:hypothetical protein
MVWRRKKQPPGERRQRRSARDWAWRGVLALAAVLLGYLGVTGALARVSQGADPVRAHLLAPGNGAITAALAEQEFASTPEAGADSKPARIARLALRQDATAADALNVLGLQAQMRGETQNARRLFGYALLLSRRELRPQIWAIEEAVNRGDIVDALRGYDIALRTSSSASRLLFPVLASALAEPRVRAALLPIIKTRPVWAGRFVDYVVTSRVNPAAGVTFFREAKGAGLPVDDDQRAMLVNALWAAADSDQAWAYYATFRRDADRRRSRDPEFVLQADTRTLFDWRASDDARLSAVILGGKDGGMLDFAVPSTVGGTLVTQTQLLPPGTYRLEGLSSGIDQPDRSRPYWMLQCRDGRELGRVPLPNSEVENGRFAGEFTVPADCPEQTLRLVARSTDAIAGVSGQIDRAALVPAHEAGAGS